MIFEKNEIQKEERHDPCSLNNENICDIDVISSELNGCELGPEFADLMIDEYPILAIAASFANSPSIFRGLNELKVKESDRLKLILLNLFLKFVLKFHLQ